MTVKLGPPPVPLAERAPPWYAAGVPVAGARSVREALQLAGLDLELEKVPLYVGDARVPYPRRVALTRVDTGEVLALVSPDRRATPTRDLFGFAGELVAAGLAELEAAGSISRGKDAWLVLGLRGRAEVAGEPYHLAVQVATRHDGQFSTRARVLPVRLANQAVHAVALPGEPAFLHRRHAAGPAEPGAGRRVAAFALAHAGSLDRLHRKLAALPLTADELRAVLAEAVFRPRSTRTRPVVELFEDPAVVGHPGTRLGALEALAEYVDWRRDRTSARARYVVTTIGDGYRWRTALLRALASAGTRRDWTKPAHTR